MKSDEEVLGERGTVGEAAVVVVVTVAAVMMAEGDGR